MNLTRTRWARAVVTVAAVAAVVSVAGCGQHTTAANSGPSAPISTSSVSPLPPPFAGVDQQDPMAVMTAAVTALFTYDPARDRDQQAATDRVQPLMDPTFYTDSYATLSALAPITGGQWDDWAAADAHVAAAVQVLPDDHPADTPNSRSRVLSVDLAAEAAAGPVGDPIEFTVYTTVTHTTGAWRVSALMSR